MPDDPSKKAGDGDLKLSENKEFKGLLDTVKGLALLVQQGQQQQVKLREEVSGLVTKLNENPGGRKSDDGDGDPNPDAINELDNSGLVKIILQEVGKVMDDKLKAVSDDIKKTNSAVETNELKKEYQRLAGEYKDFTEWNGEMKKLAESHPTLPLEELYHMARRNNSTKTAEIDAKNKAEDDKTKGDTHSKFMGLMPTSTPHDAGGKEKVTQEEAGVKAWDDVVSQFPALATPGED